MKKPLSLILFIVILVCQLVSCSFYKSITVSSYSRVLKNNWGLELPKDADCEPIYLSLQQNSNRTSFFGDGVRYNVYSYQDERIMSSWVQWHGDGASRFYESYVVTVEAWLSLRHIDENQYPITENADFYYRSKDMNELIMIKNKELKLLYIAENFI